jgi:hypothetical protein
MERKIIVTENKVLEHIVVLNFLTMGLKYQKLKTMIYTLIITMLFTTILFGLTKHTEKK